MPAEKIPAVSTCLHPFVISWSILTCSGPAYAMMPGRLGSLRKRGIPAHRSALRSNDETIEQARAGQR